MNQILKVVMTLAGKSQRDQMRNPTQTRLLCLRSLMKMPKLQGRAFARKSFFEEVICIGLTASSDICFFY